MSTAAQVSDPGCEAVSVTRRCRKITTACPRMPLGARGCRNNTGNLGLNGAKLDDFWCALRADRFRQPLVVANLIATHVYSRFFFTVRLLHSPGRLVLTRRRV